MGRKRFIEGRNWKNAVFFIIIVILDKSSVMTNLGRNACGDDHM